MKGWKKMGVICLLAAALLAGYLLPEAVSAAQDRRLNGSAEEAAVQTVQLEMGSDLTLVEKLQVLAAETYSELSLTSAQQMEYEEATVRLKTELERLFEEDDLLFAGDFSETEHRVRLLVSGEEYVLLWEFTLENEDGDRLQVQLDDDSGRILSLQYTLQEGTVSDIYMFLEEKGRNVWDYADELAVRYVEYLQDSGELTDVTEVLYAWAEDPGRIWKPEYAEASGNAVVYDSVSGQEAVAETEQADPSKIPAESFLGNEVYDSDPASAETGAESWTAFVYFQAEGEEENLLELAVQVSETAVSVGGVR
ncbi:MAG: hypothetical protein LUC27_05160 [Lachnospiraceae bacterium]|nr:hypothetical protein [Lachnospiraceae bacterium]